MPSSVAVPLLSRIAVDVTPLRGSRDFRLLEAGTFVSGLGAQAALVALPYQVYAESGSAFLTGLLGAAELLPLIVLSLLGGHWSDRFDRRKLLLLDQVGLVLTAAVLSLLAYLGEPPIWALFVLAGCTAAFNSVQNVARSAIVPNVVPTEQLASAMALNFGLTNLTIVIGPAIGGVLIAAIGLDAVYAIDALTCLAIAWSVWAMSPQPPERVAGEDEVSTTRSIVEGLRFVGGNRALLGSFVIDLSAMTFGMPRALFPVMAVGIYGAGASGTGLLYAAVSAGAVVAAFTAGWLRNARRLGRIVVWAVLVWGAAIAFAGFAGSIWIAAALFAVAGAADSVSAVCRSTINQVVTPDHLRGRMSSVFFLVVASGPRLGDVEAGTVASLTTTRTAVVSGGVACALAVGVVCVAFPPLWRFDLDRDRVAREAVPA
jgi:MFS family permease